MANIDEIEKCFICTEKYKIMISLEERLNDCEELTVAQVLQNLNFSTEKMNIYCRLNHKGYNYLILLMPYNEEDEEISDGENVHRFVCFICVSKIQSFYEFKMLCNQTDSTMKSVKQEVIYESPIDPISIKLEDTWENTAESINDQQFSINDNIKSEINIDEPIKEEKNITPNNRKSFICRLCGNCFKNKANLRQHSVLHTGVKPHVCDVCNKSFTQASHLKTHQVTHSGAKPYTCNFCNKSFNQTSNLAAHKLIHTGEKPYECDVCKKSFNHPSSLSRHKVFMHSPLDTVKRPFVCDVCDKTFKQKSHLESHKIMHLDAKPYSCEFCNKSFRRSSNYEAHKVIHNGEKPYACTVCKKSFNQSSSLSRHKSIHTKKKQP